jgi:Tol biopolymer transport system component
MSNKGRQLPGESRPFRDEQTRATGWQMTSDASINHTLYFLTNSFLPDETSLIFASFRGGAANFYRAAFPEGPITQLTDSPGINSFSAVLSHDGTKLYFTRESHIVALDLADLKETVLSEFPGGKLG